jgi:hypothetical protein
MYLESKAYFTMKYRKNLIYKHQDMSLSIYLPERGDQISFSGKRRFIVRLNRRASRFSRYFGNRVVS